MEWFNILMARLRALFRRESVLRDIEEELRVHTEMETETNIGVLLAKGHKSTISINSR